MTLQYCLNKIGEEGKVHLLICCYDIESGTPKKLVN